MALPGVDTNLEDGNLGLTGSDNVEYVPLIVGVAQDGSISPVTCSNAAPTGTVTTSGNPTVDLSIKVKITLSGNLATAKYRVSLDGGTTYGLEFTTPASGAVDIGSGVSITFGGTAFVLDDIYSFTTIAGAEIKVPHLVTQNNFAEIFRSGPLFEALKEYFNTQVPSFGYPAKAYGIRPENDSAGSIGSVTATQVGDGVFAASGTPTRDMSVIVEIVLVAGECETAKYRYSIDGGETWSDPVLTPATTTSAYIGHGVLITFTDATPPSWQIGDKFEFLVVGKTSTNVLKALTDSLVTPVCRDTVKYLGEFGFISVVSASDLDDWNVMKILINNLESAGYPVWAIMQTCNRDTDTVQTWKDAIISEANTFFDKRIAIVPISVNTALYTNHNAIEKATAKYAVVPVNRALGRVADGMVDSLQSVVDDLAIKPYKLELSNARFIIVMNYPDTDGYYFGHDYVMSASTSDYKYVPDIRVATKARRLAQQRAIRILKSDFIAVQSTLTSIAAAVQDYTKRNMVDEVTDLQVEVTSTLADLSQNGFIEMRLLINRRLVVDDITINVGFMPPEGG